MVAQTEAKNKNATSQYSSHEVHDTVLRFVENPAEAQGEAWWQTQPRTPLRTQWW